MDKYFECSCGDFRHLLRVSEEDFGDIKYLIVCHNMDFHLPWYKRIPLALAYVLGITADKIQYSKTLLNKEKVKELRDYLNDFLREKIDMNDVYQALLKKVHKNGVKYDKKSVIL